MIVTKESILLIDQLKSCKARIPLRKIRGMMVYYYDHKETGLRSTINMELDDGKVVRLHTNNPTKNQIFVEELRRQLQQLSDLDK